MTVNSVEGGDPVSRAQVAPCTGHLGSPFGVQMRTQKVAESATFGRLICRTK
jgi:hypothetical protein